MLTTLDAKSKSHHSVQSLRCVSTDEVPRSIEEILKTDPFLAPSETELPAVIKKAGEGDALSQHLYACHLEMNADYQKAMEFYEKAAKINFSYSIYNLASLYAEGKGCKRDSLKSLSYLTQPAVSQYGPALALLAQLNTDDENVPQNLPQALELFKKAANCNPPSTTALIRLGMYSELGLLGVKKNTSDAIKYYTSAMRSCSLINRSPQIHLGLLYLKDPKTHKLAFNLFHEGLKVKCQVSASYVAYCQIHGFGTKINIPLGLKTLQKIVKESVPQALYLYAQLIQSGIPGYLAKNPDTYHILITTAASLMHIESLFIHTHTCDQIHFANGFQNTDTKTNHETLENKHNSKTAATGKDDTLPKVQAPTEEKGKKEFLKSQLNTIVKTYASAALNGVLPAMHELGLCYLEGRGVPKNESLAHEWISIAANNNHPESMVYLGLSFLHGICVNQNDKLAFEWLELASNKGSADAAFLLAKEFYRNGYKDVTKKNDALFLNWMQKAQRPDNPEASYELGLFYFDEGSFDLSFKSYQAAAKLGHLHAMIQTARCYLMGYGVTADPKKGFEDLIKLMPKHDFAKINVGYCYLEGLGTPKNIVKAKHIFTEISSNNNLDDFTRNHLLLICNIYEAYDSKNFSEVFNRSLQQLEGFAKQNHQIAIQQLGEIYKKGIGVKCDIQQALVWFELGAKHPSSNALFELANLYEQGMGVKENHELALSHYHRAIILKDKRAEIRWNAVKLFNTPKEQSTHKFYLTLQNLAQQGFQEAQIMTAICYVKQLGGKKCPPPQKGFKQLKEICDKIIVTPQSLENSLLMSIYKLNDKTAQPEYMQVAFLNLGICYLKGIGIELDLNAARLWFTKTIGLNLPETIHARQAQDFIQKIDDKIKLEQKKVFQEKQLQEKLTAEQALKDKIAHESAILEKYRKLEIAKEAAAREAALLLEKAIQKKLAHEAEVLEKIRQQEAAEKALAEENAMKVKIAQEAVIANAKQQRTLQEAVERLPLQATYNSNQPISHFSVTPIIYHSLPLYWIHNRLYVGNQPCLYFSNILYPTYHLNPQNSLYEYIGDYPPIQRLSPIV